MARINIENHWWEDPRRTALIGILGNQFIVDGIWFSLVRQAQLRYNSESNGLLSMKLVKTYPHWEDFLDQGLLELREEQIYVSGTDEHFAWLKDAKDTGSRGGKESAKRSRDEKGRLLPKGIQGSSKGSLDAGSNDPRVSNPPPLPPSLKNTYIHTNELPDQISKAWSVWNDTLESFGIPRTNIAPPQESSIARGIRSLGIENVLLALTGARFESPGKDFRPQDHLTIDRALHKDRFGKSNWERFKNLALESSSKRSAINEEEEARRIAEHGRVTA